MCDDVQRQHCYDSIKPHKMAKDYQVTHFKKDDVDHDTITIDNWQEQKDKLEVYLRGMIVFNSSRCSSVMVMLCLARPSVKSLSRTKTNRIL